ncbi:MAG: hybrid sensor histidine kinase/response regulator, partial [Ignavibacteriales bacterium]|nr:hybrid sensor histidine kinase/response regulator [Ignavibacteriales bacterium]
MSNADQIILLVDDEPDLLDITASYLKMEGYSTLTAHSGPEALSLMVTTTPALIISDISMPEMSGFEFFDEVRKQDRFQGIPFIFLSGHSDPHNIRKGKEIGSDDYLIKPFDPGILIATIRGKLKRKEQLTASISQQYELLKNRLFFLLSHEMRTPLTSIMGASEILAGSGDSLSPEDFKEFLEMLQTGSKRLSNMIEDFLFVVKLESGELFQKMELRNSYLSPFRILETITAQYDTRLKAKNVTLTLDAVDQVMHLLIFMPHLDDILHRLTDNAVKFCHDHGAITITAATDGSRCIFSIQDSGPGIPSEEIEKVFDKFHQILREQTEQQGAGLGLYISKVLANANECPLKCFSDGSTGSTFTLEVPIRQQ